MATDVNGIEFLDGQPIATNGIKTGDVLSFANGEWINVPIADLESAPVDLSNYTTLQTIQTITGLKTFQLSPIVPTVDAADDSTKAASTGFVKNQGYLTSAQLKTLNGATIVGAGNITAEPVITAGDVGQYYRGDKTWQTLNKTVVGLSNVDNTSDDSKPVSAAVQTALSGKAATVHQHVISDVTGLQTALDGKQAAGSYSLTSHTHQDATTSVAGFMQTTDKSKLDGIAQGATNYTHPANHPASIITQDSSNRFVTDAEKTAWDAKQTALGFTPENATNKGVANGYASLDASGKVPTAQLPAYVDDILEFANLAGFPGTGETGKIYVALDTNKTYRWGGSSYTYITSGAVDSVAGKTGVVALVKADVGLSNVDNTSDSNKPVSSAQQTALNLKLNAANPSFTGTFTGSNVVIDTAGLKIIGTTYEINPNGARFGLYSGHTFPETYIQTPTSGRIVFWNSGTTEVASIDESGNLIVTGTITGTLSGNASSASVVPWSGVSSKPTTLSGYGITDAISTAGGNIGGVLRVSHTGNTTSYVAAGFEVSSPDNTPPGIAFHRVGYSATLLYESNGELFANAWTTRSQSGKLVSSGNYNEYSPSLTGTGASGTWSISVSGNAATASSVGWSGVTSKPDYLVYYQGFVLDANTMAQNATGFTYALNAPYTGPITRFGGGDNGEYDLWLNAPYVGGNGLVFRTRNGDTNTLNPWRTVLHDGNYNSYAPTLTGTGASGTWPISVSGNAATATTLQTARTINGVSFNGGSNVMVPSLYDGNYRRITNPGGGEYTGAPSGTTGALAIVLPVGMTRTMVRMTIKVYVYGPNQSFDLHCGGYNYPDDNTWINSFAYIVANPDADRRYNVRFGYDSVADKAIVYIGELGTVWEYPQVFVTDVECGYSGYSASWVSGWTVGVETAAFKSVTATISYAQVGFRATTNIGDSVVLRDGLGNFSAGTITATLAGNAASASVVSWSGVSSKPTTLSGYGITDAISTAGGTVGGTLTVNSASDVQLFLASPDNWTGISFNDSGANNDYLWHNGINNTFALGGPGQNVANKKLHIHGGTTIGTGYSATAAPTNGLNVEGAVQEAGNQVLHAGNFSTYAAPIGHVGSGAAAHAVATGAVAGFMAAADKGKLDGIQSGATANTGTVTSVSGTGTVSGLTLTGAVTSTGNLTLGGTLAVTPANFASQSANAVLIAPNGASGVPTFRSLLATDIPTLNQNTTGQAGNTWRLSVTDTRATNDQPQAKIGYTITADFKNNAAVGSPPVTSTVNYSHIMTVAGWDTGGGSGGWPAQVSFGDGMAIRQGTSATEWGSWRTVLHSNNFNSYAPTLTGTGASGTWAIDVSGRARVVYQSGHSDTHPAVVMNSAGAYYGHIAESAGQAWGLGWGSGVGTGTNFALTWTTAGTVNIPNTLTRGGNVVLDASNFNSYSPTLTGTGASGTWPISVSGNAATSGVLSPAAAHSFSASTNGRDFVSGVQASFVSAAQGYPQYGSVVRVHTYANDGGCAEVYFPYAAAYGGSSMRYRLGLYDNAGWTGWKTVLDSDNVVSYAPSLTGTGASGTWSISVSGNAATAGTAGNVTGTVAVANGGTGSTSAAGARTNLGATTAGANFFTLTNPSVITFPRINADNTVSALSAADFRTAIGAGAAGAEADTLATVTARGATTSTAVQFLNHDNHFSGHIYYNSHDANGNHYPQFLDGTNGTGAVINWRLFTGPGQIGALHQWTTTLATFGTNTQVNGTFRNVLTSGQAGDTLLGAINGVSNGYQISNDVSNNITYKWHGSDGLWAEMQAGKLAIGTAIANAALSVSRGVGSSGFVEIAGNGQTSAAMLLGQDSGGTAYCWQRANNFLLFGTNNTERARISADGKVSIATTTAHAPLTVRTTYANPLSTSYKGAINIHDELNGVAAHLELGVAYNGGSQYSWLQQNSTGGVYPLCLNVAGGNVGINTPTPAYTLEVNGSFAATTKSFVIDHPTKEGKKLRYGSLEGPENGVYVRGKQTDRSIELPEYWTKLVDPDSITVQLTAVGKPHQLWVVDIKDNTVYIDSDSEEINCFYYILAERVDVGKLQVEID